MMRQKRSRSFEEKVKEKVSGTFRAWFLTPFLVLLLTPYALLLTPQAIAQTLRPARSYSILGGPVAHDSAAVTYFPLLEGCYASAAAPSDVSADNDAVRAWCLRNGARVVQPTFAGVLATTGNGAADTGTQRVSEANNSQLSAGVGATGDAASSAGGTGSLSAKLRLMSQQLEDIKTAVQLIDNDQTGASVHYRTSAGATEDEHEIKATAGRLFSITITNTNAAARYLRCYNLTAANTTPGTSTVFFGMAIPGSTTGAGFTANFGAKGLAFSTALTCTFTTGAADTDVAEVAANEIKAVYGYE